METNNEFFKPIFEGKRFDDHSIPLEVLEDLGALEVMLNEVARWVYLKENPKRKRLPRGFNKNHSLKLSSIEEGSAKTVILYVNTALNTLFSSQTSALKYFDIAKEKIVQSINAIQNNQDPTDILPEHLLSNFNRIGKRLLPDESIGFPSKNGQKAVLNKENRRKILLSLSDVSEIKEQIMIKALIPTVDKKKKTFTIETDNGGYFVFPKETRFWNVVLDAFNGYDEKTYVHITGIGNFNKYNKLVSIDSIEYITIFDPFDITLRLDEILKLKKGWYDGENGEVYSKEQLETLATSFEQFYDENLPNPAIFPMIEGGISVEWTMKDKEASLTVDLLNMTGFLHIINTTNDASNEENLNLTLEGDWNKLNTTLKTAFEYGG